MAIANNERHLSEERDNVAIHLKSKEEEEEKVIMLFYIAVHLGQLALIDNWSLEGVKIMPILRQTQYAAFYGTVNSNQ